ncbi:2Fe-2S iron-sulfur cluster binding domain-containing protein [Acidobacteria bacterium AB60]|nr:2Fe-2S iron-sulfur cluster binding domain-containing protein [Acidobacteria bacterium AB60]
MDNHPTKSRESASSPTEISRRDFVQASAAIAGSIALGIPAIAQQPGINEPSVSEPEYVALSLTVNGKQHEVSIDSRTSLLDLLREALGLYGTKKGCDRGQCGACTVLVNGQRIVSCLSLAACHDGDQVTTIEGLGTEEQLHPVQLAFLDHDGFQCGYCTPGQICSAVALLKEWKAGEGSALAFTPNAAAELSRDEIRERMSGNLCRCSAYANIVAAVEAAHRSERSA